MPLDDYQKRSVGFLFLALVIGGALGALLGDLISLVLPEGVVKQFFLQSVSWGISPFTIDLLVASFTLGFRVKFSISSVLGLGGAYYVLRYFK